jgi:hypothetical protein
MSNQLPQDQWSLSSDAAYYRNWPVDLVIRSYFGEQEFNATGEKAFKKQVRLDPCLLVVCFLASLARVCLRRRALPHLNVSVLPCIYRLMRVCAVCDSDVACSAAVPEHAWAGLEPQDHDRVVARLERVRDHHLDVQ